jgi:hypothetical protein
MTTNKDIKDNGSLKFPERITPQSGDKLYEVPEAYFDELSGRIMDRIADDDIAPVARLQRRKSYYYAAAAILILMISIPAIYLFRSADQTETAVSVEWTDQDYYDYYALTAYSEASLVEMVVEYSPEDEYIVLNSLGINYLDDEISGNRGLSEDDIMEYLLEKGLSENELIAL